MFLSSRSPHLIRRPRRRTSLAWFVTTVRNHASMFSCALAPYDPIRRWICTTLLGSSNPIQLSQQLHFATGSEWRTQSNHNGPTAAGVAPSCHRPRRLPSRGDALSRLLPSIGAADMKARLLTRNLQPIIRDRSGSKKHSAPMVRTGFVGIGIVLLLAVVKPSAGQSFQSPSIPRYSPPPVVPTYTLPQRTMPIYTPPLSIPSATSTGNQIAAQRQLTDQNRMQHQFSDQSLALQSQLSAQRQVNVQFHNQQQIGVQTRMLQSQLESQRQTNNQRQSTQHQMDNQMRLQQQVMQQLWLQQQLRTQRSMQQYYRQFGR
jgi:hypothetical protein